MTPYDIRRAITWGFTSGKLSKDKPVAEWLAARRKYRREWMQKKRAQVRLRKAA